MSYPDKKRYFPAGIGAAGALGAIDISDAAATVEFTWVPKDRCVIYGFGGLCTEAAGTQTTTPGAATLSIGGTVVSTITSIPSQAIGTEVLGTHFHPTTVLPGVAVTFTVSVQAVGGTIVGEYAPWVEADFFPAIAGV